MPIAFSCSSCGASFAVDDGVPGPEAKCPACGAYCPGPEGVSAPCEVPPDSPATAGGTDSAETVPHPPQVASKSGRASFVVAGALVSIGLAIAGALWWHLSAPVPDLDYMPDNSELIVSLRVEEAMATKAFKDLERDFPDLRKKSIPALDAFGPNAGLSLDRISSVLSGVGRIAATEPMSRRNTAEVNVIRTRDRLTADDLLANLAAAGVSRPSGTGVRRYTVYSWDTDGFCVPEPGVVLYGNPESLAKVLRRDGPPKVSEGMKASLNAADLSQPLAVAVDPNVMRSGGALGGLPGLPRATEKLYRDAVALTMEMSVDTEIRSKATIVYKDARAAADAGKIMDDEAIKMKKELAKLKASPAVPKYVIKDMESGQHAVNGDRIETSHVLDLSFLVKMIKESK